MPKDKGNPYSSLAKSRASHYQCSRQLRLGNPELSAKVVNEWEEARCPICMEPPHNAVLLRCSSYEKGCRPYMCDTSYRHSNCLDLFSKTGGSLSDSVTRRRREETVLPGQIRQIRSQVACPLCRGQVYGIVVIDTAREYMNSKQRSCSCETCEFTGSYPELRKHARSEHPAIYPSTVDPTRQANWIRLKHETETRDLLCMIESSFGAGENFEDSALPPHSVDSALPQNYVDSALLFRNMNIILESNRSFIWNLVELALIHMELFPESHMPQYSTTIQEMLEDIVEMDAWFIENDPVTALRRMYEREARPTAQGRFDRNAGPTSRMGIDDRQNGATSARSTLQDSTIQISQLKRSQEMVQRYAQPEEE